MVDTRAQSNNKVGWFVGPDNAIPNARWVSGPTLADLTALLNISTATKIDGTDFGLEASEQSEDRSFTDAAGAQSRSFDSASGNIEIYTPGKGDNSSIYAQTWSAMSKPRTKLALAQRFIKLAPTPLAAGDEINVFRVQTDARQHNRNDSSRTLGIGLVLQDDILVNYIVPSATPNPVVVAAQGGSNIATAAALGSIHFLRATYEGRNVTVGTTWVSSNENVATVTRHGIVRISPTATPGATATISATVKGSAAGTGIAVKVAP
jgi:hypothetical protein